MGEDKYPTQLMIDAGVNAPQYDAHVKTRMLHIRRRLEQSIENIEPVANYLLEDGSMIIKGVLVPREVIRQR